MICLFVYKIHGDSDGAFFCGTEILSSRLNEMDFNPEVCPIQIPPGLLNPYFPQCLNKIYQIYCHAYGTVVLLKLPSKHTSCTTTQGDFVGLDWIGLIFFLASRRLALQSFSRYYLQNIIRKLWNFLQYFNKSCSSSLNFLFFLKAKTILFYVLINF